MLRVADTAPPVETALDSPTNGGALLALQFGLEERLEELLQRIEQMTSVGGHFDEAASINVSEAAMHLGMVAADHPHITCLTMLVYFIAKVIQVTSAADRDLSELVADLDVRNEIAGLKRTLKELFAKYPVLASDVGHILQADISF